MEKIEDWSQLQIDMGAAEEDPFGWMGTPMGNGIFSAKENGGITEDIFQLNHSTFWSGDPPYRDSMWKGEEKDGYGHTWEERRKAHQKLVETLKEAYREGISQKERDILMESLAEITKGLWESNYHSAFLPVGQLRLKFPGIFEAENYRRVLDLDQALSVITFEKNGVGYRRETFISNPDQVMVTRITNDSGCSMEMEAELALPPEMTGKSSDNQMTVQKEEQQIVMTGRAPYNFPANRWDENRGILMDARVRILLPRGGKVTESAAHKGLKVSEAEEILLIYTCTTSYKDNNTDPSHSGVDCHGIAENVIRQACDWSYTELKEAHLKEYRSLFRRFWIEMEGNAIISSNGTPITPWEYARHYQYGRYVNISCERKNSIMAQGLLGMWCPVWLGPNEGAYFLNENMEKMQTLKGAGNLSDSSDGQYNVIKSWADIHTGQRTAEEIYGAEPGSWMMAHSTGIWGKSGMWGETVEYGSWLAGGIWALDVLYDKYEYTQDKNLLRKYYPLLEGAVRFALSTLIEVDGVNGELKGYKVVAPAGSPEHWYWVNGTKVAFDIASACDTLLYYNLFHLIERAAKELEQEGISCDEVLLERVKKAREQMIPMEFFIDKESGRLKEWYNEYPIGDERHRHASHLLGLFLGHLKINERETPELFQAQKRETLRWITANGGTHPDRSLMALRAGFEDFAFSHFSGGIVGTGYKHEEVLRWTAIASSIAEAVVDSRFDEIHIMEHLPKAWKNGKVKGICARGGYQLNVEWKDGDLVFSEITSVTGKMPKVRYKGKEVNLVEDSRFMIKSRRKEQYE